MSTLYVCFRGLGDYKGINLIFWEMETAALIKKTVVIFQKPCYTFYMQIWFIGRTLASQAGKAGSTPVICCTQTADLSAVFKFGCSIFNRVLSAMLYRLRNICSIWYRFTNSNYDSRYYLTRL